VSLSEDFSIEEDMFEMSSMPARAINTQDALTVRDCSFALKRGDAPILKDINIQIPTSSINIVIGKVG
jgi:ABC-type bacteriocin/lantibiotic exporter with double-glycine peptidase domain